MPFDLPLPNPLPSDGWKVKILDAEPDYEEPHLTIRWKTKHWRISLRTRRHMDEEPPIGDVRGEVLAEIDESWDLLVREWNRRHPDNPV